jgi:DNA-binding IclR family transcriptional regulator
VSSEVDASAEGTRRDERRGIQSIETGFRIIDALIRTGRPMPLKELAAAVALPAPNVHFYLVSLVRIGMVSQDEATGHYRIGPYGLKIGIACLEQFDLFSVARPILASLAQASGYTTFLGVWGNHGPTIVYRIDGSRSPGIFELRIGSVLPLLSSALGRVFLAYLPTQDSAALLRAELAQPGRPGAGRADLDVPTDIAGAQALAAEVRAQGMSRCRSALLSDFTALSAPVRDHAGNIIAAVTVMGPLGVFDDAFDGAIGPRIREAADAISHQAGYPGRG